MKNLIFALLLLYTNLATSHTQKLNVLVSINPIYSLVKNVTHDLDNVDLLVNPNISPHHYQLKPSDVRKLKKADLIFIVDKNFENFLHNYLSKDDLKHKVVQLSHSPGIFSLPARNIKVLNTQHEDTHSHCSHHHEHNHAHGHDHHHDHAIDLHLWTDTRNVGKMLNQIESSLSRINPEHSHLYKKNTSLAQKKIYKLDDEIRDILDDQVQKSHFIVFHDAYQYFEKRYNLQNAGSVAGSNFIYGPKTLQELRNNIYKNNVKCIFAEPQFSSEMMKRIARNTSTNIGYLDIEGGSFGKKINAQDLYFSMMKQNALNIRNCIKE